MDDMNSSVQYVLVCEDSLEGILTGVYDAYALRKGINNMHLTIEGDDNLMLFSEYVSVVTDAGKSASVSDTIISKFGMDPFESICFAAISGDSGKAEDILGTIVCGLGMKNPRRVMENLANDHVNRVTKMRIRTGYEIQHLKGFLRFTELETGVLYAEIAPKSNSVPYLMEHFANRLPLENFVIHDSSRDILGIHPKSKEWFMARATQMDKEALKNVRTEQEDYEELFRHFCKSIAIKERTNYKLQRNMLPLRFRKFMTEFQ